MKPVFIAVSPNTQPDDIKLAFRLLFQPWKWFDSSLTVEFEQQMDNYLGKQNISVAMDSARSAFYMLLKTYGIGPGDEVILPSFSCLVVANPVIWVGAKPVYVDINESTLNTDLEKLKQKVTKNTKAVLVQHTFGRPIDVEKVRAIVGNNVIIIEDVAHALGGEVNGEKIGTQADAAILTFGIEKSISTIRGGMALTKDAKIYGKLKAEQKNMKKFGWARLKISLINPLLWAVFTPIYYLGIGKFTIGRIFVTIAHKFGLLGNMIERCEYDTEKPSWLPAKMPGALAALGINQLKKLDEFRSHRFQIASIYDEELDSNFAKNEKLNYLRYPLLVNNPQKLAQMAKRQGIVLGDWYKNILYAPDESLKKLGYKKGMNPVAENLSKQIINLPLGPNIDFEDASRVVKVVKQYLHEDKVNN